MGDWGLTEFNSRLVKSAYQKSADQPPFFIPPPNPAFPGSMTEAALAARDAVTASDNYIGPAALRPESMGNFEQYYRELPGAKWVLPFKFLGGTLAALAWLTAILAASIVIHGLSSSATAHTTKAPQPITRIGIVNPAWVAVKSSWLNTAHDTSGYFDTGINLGAADVQVSKFVYVSPPEAQEKLLELIKIGYVTAAGARPDVMRDFEVLKHMGITTDALAN